MDRRITGGLAWAGLLLVLAVPSADLISQQFAPSGSALSVTPEKAPAPKKAAPVATVKSAKTPEKTPVAAVVPATKKGKPMPSYISDGKANETIEDVAVAKPEATPAKPAPTRVIPGATPVAAVEDGPKVIISAPPSKAPVTVPAPQIASVDTNPMVVAPVPMPASMRPVSRPQQQEPDAIQTGAITPVNQSGYEPDEIVTSDELADWESGPLEEFLEKRRGTGTVQKQSSDYDSDGFFLSDGPNGGRRHERVFPFAYN